MKDTLNQHLVERDDYKQVYVSLNCRESNISSIIKAILYNVSKTEYIRDQT